MLTLCRFSEIPEGGTRGVAVEGSGFAQRLILARRGGRLFAYVNRCPHIGSRLDLEPGDFLDPDETGHLFCGSHAALFRVEDGVCIEGPCLGARLPPARVRLDGDRVVMDRPGLRLIAEIGKVMSDIG